MMNKNQIIENLLKLGIEEKASNLFVSLLETGPQTPLSLSRNTNINRTTIYRELEKLKESGLIEEILEENTTLFQASDPNSFNLLIVQKENEISRMKSQLPTLLSQISQITPISPNTKVLYYRGQKGIQQLLWNTLKAKDEQVGLGYTDWNDAAGRSFAEEVRHEYVQRRIYLREILNQKTSGYTDSKDFLDKFYRGRCISPKILTIKHDTYIYNNVFAYMHYYNKEYFGVEIHNQEIANTEKQVFEILWKMAK